MQNRPFTTPWIFAFAAACALLLFVTARTANWLAGPDLNEARNQAAAVLQEDGRLLVSGGENGGAISSTAEALDAIGFFTPVAAMQMPRQSHASLRLLDGRVLAVGGTTTGGGATETAEIYDPGADAWTLVGSLAHARAGAAALLLPDGRVLIVGGENAGGAVGSLELYDPVSQSFSLSLAQISPPRLGMAVALLADGRVLITGGADSASTTARTDLYDPMLDSLSQAQDLSTPRARHSATRLLSGDVLIAGGHDGAADLSSAELFEQSSELFRPIASALAGPRQGHLALLLPHNGSVLLLGGRNGGTDLLNAERYLPWSEAFTPAGTLSAARPGAAASPTGADGTILVLGGGSLTTSEAYAFATVKTDADDYRPRQTALISGAGFPAASLLTLELAQLTGAPGEIQDPWEVITNGAGEFTSVWIVDPEITSGATFRLSAATAGGERAEALLTSSQRVGAVEAGTQTGAAEYGSPATVSYAVSVLRGSGVHSTGSFDADLSLTTTLPPGATAVFDPPTVSFAPADTLQTATLTISTAAGTPAGESSFTVQALKTGGGPVEAALQDALLTISARPLTVTAAADARDYDGGILSAGVPTISAGSLVGSDTGAWVQNFDSDDAGARTLLVTPAPVSDGYGGSNYAVTYESVAGTIAPRAITVTASSDAKEYDGSAASAAAPTISAGSLAPGDTGSWAQAFDADDAGARMLQVIPAAVGDGNGGANYALSYAAASGSISPRVIVVAAAADVKDYDATADSAEQPTLLAGELAPGDTASWSQFFDSDDAGQRILTVLPLLVEDGNGGANYSVSYATAAGAIQPFGLSLTATADSRVYDGSLASAASPTVGGVLRGSDTVTDLAQEFDSRHAGARSLHVSGYVVNDGNGGANYAVSLVPATGAISPASLELLASIDNRVYDGTTASAAAPSFAGTLFAPDALSGLVQEFDARDAGPRSLSVTGYLLDDGNGGANYALSFTPASGSISPRDITVTAAADSRPYDSTADSAATPTISFNGLGAGDTASWVQSFDSDDAGPRLLTVTPASVLDGNGGANYVVSYETAAGAITPAALDIVAASDSRSYDGSMTSAALPTAAPFGSDTVTGLAQVFDDRHAGARVLSVSSYVVNDGNGGANYAVNLVDAAGSISPAALELIASADSKAYDGTPASAAMPTHAGTLFGADALSNLAQEFDSRNAGSRGLSVTSYLLDDGNGGANYALSFTPATGDISPAALELVAAADSRIYDGTAASAGAPSINGTLYAPDTLTNLEQEFDSRNAGARSVSVTGYLLDDGNGGANYALSFTSASGSIAPAALELTATPDNREYDGSIASAVAPAFNGALYAPDTLTNLAQEFDSRDAGARSLSVSSYALEDGNVGANYALSFAGAAGSISPRTITVSAAADSRVYDTTTASNASPVLTGGELAPGDTGAWSQSFDGDDAGARLLTVTPSDVNDGNGGGNYLVLYATAAGLISPAPLDLVAASDSRAYDGSLLSTGVPTAAPLGSDTVTNLAQSFDSRNAGARILNVSSYTVNDGNGGANYAVNLIPAAGDIVPAALELIAAPDSRIYDGMTASAGAASFTGTLFAPDTLVNLIQEFDGRNAGARSLSVTGYLLDDGNGGANYALSFTPASGSISPRDITVTAAADSRVYDSTNFSAETPAITGNSLAAGDTGSWSQSFDSDDAGPRLLTVTPASVEDGNGGANYLVSYDTAAGSITPAMLVIAAASESRLYDGSTASASVPTAAPLGSDTVTDLVQVFDSRNTGARILSVSDYTVNDGNGGANYAVNLLEAAGSISPAPLALVAAPDSRSYDGTVFSSAAPGYSGTLYAPDTLTNLRQEFNQRNAGARALYVTEYTLEDGNADRNYAITFTPATGTISPATLELAAAADSRIYDGTAASAGAPSYNGTLYAPDTLTNLTQEFDSRNAGARNLSVTGFLLDDGNGGANYALTLATAVGSISPRDLLVTAVTDTRIYDTTPASTETPALSGSGLAPGDTGVWEQYFDGDDAGPRVLSVTPASVEDGNGGANYLVSYATAPGQITPAALEVVAVSDSRSYDGSTASAGIPTAAPLGSDTVTGLAQVFDDRHAGTRTLSVSSYLVNDGNGGANYVLSLVNAAGSISPAPLDLLAVADSKDYDGTPASAAVPTYSGTLHGADSISGLDQEFDSRNAGARSLFVTNYQVDDGNGGANYSVNQVPASGTITPAALTLTALADSRVYDGTSASAVAPAFSGTLYAPDTLTNLSQEFDSRNAGARTLGVTGYSLADGNGGSNYALSFVTASGAIDPRTITVAPTPHFRSYDGTTGSSLTPTITEGSLGADDAGNWVQRFYTRNVGSPRWLTVNPAAVEDGNGGANYAVSYDTTPGEITPATLDIVATGETRTYDATTLSAAVPTANPFSGDTVTGLDQVFDGKNAGPRTLSVSSYLVNDGNGGTNYAVNLVDAAGTISPAVLDVYTTADSKVYDGTPDSSLTPTVTGTLYGTDTLTNLEQAFDSRDAGTRSLLLSQYDVNDGNGGANYQVLEHPAGGVISRRPLTITATGLDKRFDNTTTAIVTLSDDRLAGDFFTISYTSVNFSRKMLGTWPVTVLGLSISGAHAGNYAPNGTATTSATITIGITEGSRPGSVTRQPFLAQLHLHGSLSEGNATMHHHTSEAVRTGYDLLWWSDHMERTMGRLFVHHVGFEGSLSEEQAPGVFGIFEAVEPPAGFLDLTFDSGSPAAGAENLRVAFDTTAGEAWTEGRLSYEGDRNTDHKSLLADPEVSLQVRPQSSSGDATFLVRLTLSARPDGTTVGTPNVIEYLPAGMNAPAPAANVRRLPLPALQAGTWNLITLRPGQDAPPLFYEGDEQALYHVDLVFLAQDGGTMTMDVDAFGMSLLGPTDLALLQMQKDVLESRYSSNLRHEVGMEVAGPDAQGVANDARDHLVALYPNGISELIDFREPDTHPELYPQSGVDLLHQKGAVVSLAHIFGPGAGENPISEQEALDMANRIIAARAWGCDAMEVGYPWRQRPIQNHVDVWDLLSGDGVYITGTAVSDNHNVEYWHLRLNRWGSWLRATGPDAPSWLEAIRGGQVFFGDPNRFNANGDLVFEAPGGSFSMGDVVPTSGGPTAFHVAVTGAAAGHKLAVMKNGVVHSIHPFTSAAIDVVASVPVQPGDFVRVEVRDAANDPYVYSNPIYFVATGVQPPPNRTPGP